MNTQSLLDLHDAFIADIVDAVRITMAAASALPTRMKILEALMTLDERRGNPVEPGHQSEVELLRPLLQKQEPRSFAYFFNLATVSLWSTLEAFIEDLLVCILDLEPSLMQVEAVARIKVPLAEYSAMDSEERHRFVIGAVERDTAASQKPGVGGFEALLCKFNLAGSIPDEVRARILEFWAVRNVLVHRRGLADQRTIAHCPWLNKKRGEQIDVTPSMAGVYGLAAAHYGTLVVKRYLSVRGDTPTHLDEMLATTDSHLLARIRTA